MEPTTMATENAGYTLTSAELRTYTDAVGALHMFELRHHEVLKEFADLQAAILTAESALKERARLHGPEENELYKVLVTYPAKRWYDTDIILEQAPFVRDVPGVLVTTVDKAKIEALIKGGMVPKEVAQAAYKEQALTPSVTIKLR